MDNAVWRKNGRIAIYLIVLIPVGFFLAPLGLGVSFLLGVPSLSLALIALTGWALGVLTSRFCPKPDGFWLRYGPLFVLLLVPILGTIAVMAVADGGGDGAWGLPVFFSPGFFLALLIEIFSRSEGLLLAPLAPSLYALGYGAGFFREEKANGDPFGIARRVLGAIMVLTIGLIIAGASMIMRRDETFVARNHGFAYEAGFSSVNLAAYKLYNPDNILPVLSAPSTFLVTDRSAMPVLDGAEAAFPLYSAFAKACYQGLIPIGQPQTGEKPGYYSDPYQEIVAFSNTINAFGYLLQGRVDIFFGAEPSAEQRALAARAGKELTLVPIGKEAFVFFVNQSNPVHSLTSEEIRAIYRGDVKNWRMLGGDDARIMAFQRPNNSGSQTIMQRFMKDAPLMRPLKEEYTADMGGVVEKMANYHNAPGAIGYSFRFFLEGMSPNKNVRLLALDGVSPTPENIQSGAYPFVIDLYAIAVKDNPKPEVAAFLAWMQGPQGQELVEKVGYSPLAQ